MECDYLLYLNTELVEFCHRSGTKMLNKETGAGTLSTFALPLYFDV